MEEQVSNGPKDPGASKSVVDWLWRFFSSIRLAVFLIMVIAGLSLLGALVIQVPPEMAGDQQYYTYWLESVAKNKVGLWTPLLSALGLFDVFRSPLFLIAGTLLMLNIFICTVNRLKVITSSLHPSVVKHEAGFYASSNTRVEINAAPLPAAEAVRITEKVLKARGYRTRSESDGSDMHVAADKNRYYPLGTILSHFSLVLFVLAFITGGYFGFRDSSFTVPVGAVREVGHNTGLSLKLTSFVDEYYENGMPKDYRSQVNLYENGKVVKQALIRVNEPLAYNGVRFYQSYFGQAAKILVRDENGRVLFNDNVPLDNPVDIQGSQFYEGFFDLPQKGFMVRLISPTQPDSPMIPEGQLAVDLRQGNRQIGLALARLGTPRVVAGMEFTFLEESNYSGFQVTRDPTNALIWIASTLFMIGICAVFYFPYRQVWLLSQPIDQGNSRLLIRGLDRRRHNSTSEFNSLVNQIERAFTAYRNNSKDIGQDRDV